MGKRDCIKYSYEYSDDTYFYFVGENLKLVQFETGEIIKVL